VGAPLLVTHKVTALQVLVIRQRPVDLHLDHQLSVEILMVEIRGVVVCQIWVRQQRILGLPAPKSPTSGGSSPPFDSNGSPFGNDNSGSPDKNLLLWQSFFRHTLANPLPPGPSSCPANKPPFGSKSQDPNQGDSPRRQWPSRLGEPRWDF
jgi:hypothetical protein